MKLFLLLLLFSAAYASSFGYSRIELTRVWSIEAPEPGADISFEGMLIFNDSHQKVYLLQTEPEMEVVEDGNGSIRLIYNGTIDGTVQHLMGTTLVEVFYNTSLKDDPPLPDTELTHTELTEPSAGIRVQAEKLKGRTTLETIKNIANWVHQNIEYNLDYAGRRSAQDVFTQRKGVCVEYSHLFISMVRSLGLETRYVSGYVMVNGAWQAHAWTEVFVPDYGWLPVDPTFGEAGILDNSHLIIAYGSDQSSIFDTLYSDQPGPLFNVEDSIDAKLMTEDPRGVEVEIDFQRDLLTMDVTVRNTVDEYMFGSYYFRAPDEYGGEQSEIILLGPLEEKHFYYSLQNSLFEEGYVYRIPVSASLNDASAEKEIVVEKARKEDTVESVTDASSCLLPSLIMMLLLFITSLALFDK